MKRTKFTIKNDGYKTVRDNYSRFLNIYCDRCGEFLLLYQKDGKKNRMKRMYLDRIVAPEEYANFQYLPFEQVPDIVCKKCKRIIAIPSIYEEENRKALLLLSFAFIQRISSGTYPPKIMKLEVD